ncbi:hypothetical protein KR093_004278, partial [Drosophila rubida]
QYVKTPEFNVFTSECKIPKLDPFSFDSMRYFKPPESKKCTNESDLVSVLYNAARRQYRLHINEDLPELIPNISDCACTYKEIVRGANDSIVWTSKATFFEQDWWVPRRFRGLIVECHLLSNPTRVIQRDAFSFVQDPVDRNDKFDEERSRTHPNVIIIGIDSMSQLNFQRTMPLTARFLRTRGWYEMLGYNKIDENTLPNIIALLTGEIPSQLKKFCYMNKPGCMDLYNFLWNHYRNAGYLTAYAEDLVAIDTFHYNLPGFMREPVDYYLYPFLKAVEENMDKVGYKGDNYCIGRRKSYRYVLDYCRQLIRRFVQEKPKPLFGLFWMKSFSHDDFSSASNEDADFLEYLERFEKLGLFDSSVVILMSDHGQRAGPLINLASGYLEERLPMLHIYVPPWHRKKYPEVARALEFNRRQLSSPFDLNVGLKCLLQLVHPRLQFRELQSIIPASLFHILPQTRTCRQAGIPPQWCSCYPYKQIEKTDWVEDLARLVVYRMNQYLIRRHHEKHCHQLKLRKLLLVELKQFFDDKGFEVQSSDKLDTYRFKFTTSPNDGVFRATLTANKDASYVVIDEKFITRLNSYRKESHCIWDNYAKRFCVCLNVQGY